MKRILVFLFVALTTQVYGQSALHAKQFSIDKNELKQTIKILASDSMEGRLTGTIGQMKAARYIAGEFAKYGLSKAEDNGYYDDFKLVQYYRGETYLKTARNRKLDDFQEMACMSREPINEEKELELIFGGKGTPEDLEQINVKNRMVLVFTKNLRSTYDIEVALEKRKAAGLILANPYNDKQFESIRRTFKNFMTRKRYTFAYSDRSENDSIGFVEFIIPNMQIRHLMKMSARDLNQLIETKAIADCPMNTVRVKCERIVNRTTGRNVIGMLKGTSDTSIYITAHYDHLGTDGRFYFRGADDNASGVASMLELAKLFSGIPDLKYNLIFLATTGEEVGELGAKYQVRRADFEPGKVLLNLNIDMVGRVDSQHIGEEAYLYSLGTDTQPKLAALFEKVDQRVPECSFDYTFNNSHDLTGYYMRSDQYQFCEKGIPAVMFFSGLHKDYHKPTDTPEKINYPLLQDRIFLISQVILALQRSESFSLEREQVQATHQ